MGCKVDTLSERYDLTVPDPDYESIDAYLVARWTGSDGRSSAGYKSLTGWFNRRLLRRIYEENGRDTMSVHLDREYEVITGEDDLERDELAADLATDDIDIERVTRELISWSTMRHHLKGCLEAEKEPEPASTDWETNTVQLSRERTEEKTRSVLSSLASKARLPNAERADVHVQVKLACPECSVRVPFDEAVERGYVCETHFETAPEDEESVRERVKHTFASIVVPIGAIELLQLVVFEESLLPDLLSVPVI